MLSVVSKLMAVPIEKVLNHYKVKIQDSSRHGDRISIRCPFHQETQSSFMIYTNSNSAYCFGCGKPYDSIAIIKEFEECRFTDAIRKLGEIGEVVIFEELLPSIRREMQRHVHKMHAGKGDEYYRYIKERIGTKFISWIEKLPKKEKFWHLVDYFWLIFEEIGEEEMGRRELDEIKDLIVKWEKFFVAESFRWMLFKPKIPRENWGERVDEDLGSNFIGNW